MEKKKYIFRTTILQLSKEGIAMVVLLLCTPLAISLNQPFTAGLLALITIFVAYALYKRVGSRLKIDPEKITYFKDRQAIPLYWSEISYVQLIESRNRPKKILLIEVSGEETLIPLDHFDHRKIWHLVQAFAPPHTLDKFAYRQTPYYQEWEAQAERKIFEPIAPLCISDFWLIQIALGMLIPAAWLYFDSLSIKSRGQSVHWIATGAFIIFCEIYAILNCGKIEMTETFVLRRSLFGTYRMLWDEVKRIGIDGTGLMVMYGTDKRLSFMSPRWWSGKDKAKMTKLLYTQIELRRIEVNKERHFVKFPRNTKVG